jgi:putative endonuclease
MRKNIRGLSPDANPMFSWLKRFFRRPDPATAVRGEAGERLAVEFLRRERGFVPVVRNWRSPRDRRAEIDLVCRDGEALVFVEVKARAAGARVPGYHAVTARKRRALRRACLTYLALLPRRPRTIRFDVVEVALPAATASAGAKPEVRHFENIPLFPKHHPG